MNAVFGSEAQSESQVAVEEPSFMRAFDAVASAPGGTAALRRLILSLAVRGKLVRQHPADEPAVDFARRIAKAAGRSVQPTAVDVPAPGWARIPLGSYADAVCTGPFGSLIAKNDYVAGGVPLVNPSHMRHGRIREDASVAVSVEKAAQLKAYALTAGDVVFARRGEVGRTALVTDREHGWLCGTGSFFARFHTEVNRAYLQIAFESPSLRAYLGGAAVGATMVNLNQRVLLAAPIDVPPPEEQRRIVARVEELMKLCDVLEAKQRLADAQHARLTSTLFEALAASESAEALAENWQRVAEHFDLLLDRPEAVTMFEQACLRLAVQGCLVPQDANEESASNLVDRPSHRSGAAGALPSGWLCVRFTDVCTVSGGSTPSKARADYWNGAVPWVSPKDMKVPVIGDSIDHVTDLALSGTSLSMVPTGSILVVVRGMILAHSFPVAVTSAPVTINQDMKALTPMIPKLAPYLSLVCQGFSSDILDMVDRSTHGTCKLESSKLFSWTFGLPPLAEQHRIVARVEELRRLCAQLRERLSATREVQSRLADALVASVV